MRSGSRNVAHRQQIGGDKVVKLIKSWEELVGLENDEYYVEIDNNFCNGFIRSKTDEGFFVYLSTHTFYGHDYQHSTVRLQECGFNVQLENWDGKTEEVSYKDQWLWSGRCEFCRRKDYCSSECKAAQRWKEHLARIEEIKSRKKQ